MAHTEVLSKKELWGGGRSPFSVTYGKMMMWFFLVSDALTFSGLLIAYGYIRHTYDVWPVGEKVFNAMPGLTGTYPLLYVALMTFILIVSSVTMVLAVEAGHRLDKRGVIKWLTLTVIGGLFFVGSQVWEWKHFIHGSGGVITTSTGEHFWVSQDMVHNDDGTYSLAEGAYLMSNRYYEGVSGEETKLDAAATAAVMADLQDYDHGANMKTNEYLPGKPQFANFFFFITGFHGFHVFSGIVINFIILMQVRNGTFDDRGHFEMVEKTGLYWHFVDLVWVFVFTFFYLI